MKVGYALRLCIQQALSQISAGVGSVTTDPLHLDVIVNESQEYHPRQTMRAAVDQCSGDILVPVVDCSVTLHTRPVTSTCAAAPESTGCIRLLHYLLRRSVAAGASVGHFGRRLDICAHDDLQQASSQLGDGVANPFVLGMGIHI